MDYFGKRDFIYIDMIGTRDFEWEGGERMIWELNQKILKYYYLNLEEPNIEQANSLLSYLIIYLLPTHVNPLKHPFLSNFG